MNCTSKLTLWAISVFIVFTSLSVAQPRPGEWKNYTSMKEVRDISVNGDSLWGATSGGLFLYISSSGLYKRFTTSEGLLSNDLTAITIDPYNRIWTGTSSGYIAMFNPEQSSWFYVRSIAESDRTQKVIRKLYISGDTLYIATDFGISVYLLKRQEFGDSYTNFGFQMPTRVNDITILNGKIYAATASGLAVGTLGAQNLTGPSAWKRYTTNNGLPSNSLISIIPFGNSVVIGTTQGAAAIQNDSIQNLSNLAGKNIVDLFSSDNQLYVLSYLSPTATIEALSSLNASPQVVSTLGSISFAFLKWKQPSEFCVATNEFGIARFKDNSWQFIRPNGPASDSYLSLAVDNNGVLWTATGVDNRGKGFYRYNPSLPDSIQWKIFTVQQYPIMRTNDYYKASIGNPGTVWMSSWGEGVVEIAGDTIRRRISTTGQPKFAGTVAGNPNYAVIGSAAVDPQGFTWFANLTAITGNYVVRLANDTTFNYFKNEVSPQMGFFYSMVVDHNGTKWFTNSETIKERYPYGLFYFNEKSLVSGTSTTNGWGVMTSADNLPDDVIFALAVDNDNNICVGTPSGMLIINDPIYPKSRNFRPYVVRTRVIQTIAVDALNNKWLGTKEGVFVINPDGTQLLEQFTVASTNGKLASNDVKTIAIDQKHGVVYFGTDYGISSYGIVATQVSRSAGTIAVGPNPFVIPSNTHLMIRNLVANSSVKIFSVDGTLITEFLAQGGGRAFWDGKDKSNKYVSSGIYFVIVFAENGEQIGTGKIAIIKK